MKKSLLLIALFAFFSLPAWAESAKQIMQQVIDAQQSDSSAMDIMMRLEGSDGDAGSRRFQTLVVNESGLAKTITVFLEPASVKNTRFLTVENEARDDDQWIYLPALRKVKRIAASEQGGSFMGSDFSYSDISFSSTSVDESTHTLLREETLSGLDCYVVESVPTGQSSSEYGKQISWVDKSTWLTPRVEFYGKDGTTVLKVLETTDFKQVEGHWIAGTMTMTTVESGHKTVLEIQQVKYGISIDPGYFTTTFLESGRTR